MHRPIRFVACVFAVVVSTPAMAVELVSVLPGGKSTDMAYAATVSRTGRYVVFLAEPARRSTAQPCPEQWYFRDLERGTTELVSRNTKGAPARCNIFATFATTADVSADGRYVVFDFAGEHLVPGVATASVRTYLLDRTTNTMRLVGDPAIAAGVPVMDHAGRYVLVETDTGLVRHDLQTGTSIALPIVAPFFSSHAISGDGQRIAYARTVSDSPRTMSIDVHDFVTNTTHVVPTLDGQPAQGTVQRTSLDADGSVVVFEADAPNLTGTTTQQIVRHDFATGVTDIVSTGTDGQPTSGAIVDRATVSDDETIVAFRALSANLPYPGPMAWMAPQLYVRQGSTSPVLVSVNDGGEPANLGVSDDDCEVSGVPGCVRSFLIRNPMIAGDGSRVVFHSFATNLRPLAGSRQWLAVYSVSLGKLRGSPDVFEGVIGR